jgi:hypothetical protein
MPQAKLALFLLCLPLAAQIHLSACTPTDSGFTGGSCYVAGVPLPTGAPNYFAQERGGDFGYSFPVVDGQYTVTLHFIESSSAVSGPGQRKFSVSINGSPVLTAFDLAAVAPLNTPVDRPFPVTVSGGAGITIAFSTVVRRAVVSAIDITPVVAPINPFPGCASDGASGITCSGAVVANGGLSGGPFDPTITWGGITYRLPAGDGTGKRLQDSGVAACGKLDPTFLANSPTCHQLIWAP